MASLEHGDLPWRFIHPRYLYLPNCTTTLLYPSIYFLIILPCILYISQPYLAGYYHVNPSPFRFLIMLNPVSLLLSLPISCEKRPSNCNSYTKSFGIKARGVQIHAKDAVPVRTLAQDWRHIRQVEKTRSLRK